jgi:hypothetical protein
MIRRLLRESIIGTAVLALLGSVASAQVRSHVFNSPRPINGPFDGTVCVDADEDGHAEFCFDYGFLMTYGMGQEGQVYVGPSSGGPGPGNPYVVGNVLRLFRAGEPISNELALPACSWRGWFAPFTPATAEPKYYAFRMPNSNGQWTCGWVLASSYAIYAWAYETDPTLPILAGEFQSTDPCPPSLFTQPMPTSVIEGQTIVLSAQVVAQNAIYQWTRDDVPLMDDQRINGAQSTLLTINQAMLGDNGTYRLKVTTSCGGVLSAPARVEVARPCPLLAGYALRQSYCSGSVGVTWNDAFSIEAWILPIGSGGPLFGGDGGSIMSLLDMSGSGGSIGIWHTSENTIQWWWADTLLGPPMIVRPREWNHLAAVYERGVFTAYLNGIPAFSVSVAIPRRAKRQLHLGGLDTFSSDNLFNGAVDEVRIWNTARTANEIVANAGRVINPQSTGLAAYYRLDEGTGYIQHDLVAGHDLEGWINWVPTIPCRR